MPWSPTVAYDDLPPLPPKADVETKPILKAAIEARAALAALDQAAQRIPNPTVLLNSLPLLEAQASSEIENIVTTADDLFAFAQHEAGAKSLATRETLRYRAALFAGIDLTRTRPLSMKTAVEVCSIIQGREVDVRFAPGTFIGNAVTKEAVYTPPNGKPVLMKMLSDWAGFVNSDDELDPLIRMALAHYQFEAIHPFSDGNGRTGRIMNVLMLLEAGVLTHPILYLSRYFIAHRQDYYRLLLEVTSAGAWEDWILFVLEGVRRTAGSTIAKIDGISDLQAEVMAAIRTATRAGANADLLAVLFEQPYSRIANVVERCHVSRPTATSWLNALVAAGVLDDVRVGRERLFINTAFFALLVRDEGE